MLPPAFRVKSPKGATKDWSWDSNPYPELAALPQCYNLDFGLRSGFLSLPSPRHFFQPSRLTDVNHNYERYPSLAITPQFYNSRKPVSLLSPFPKFVTRLTLLKVLPTMANPTPPVNASAQRKRAISMSSREISYSVNVVQSGIPARIARWGGTTRSTRQKPDM